MANRGAASSFRMMICEISPNDCCVSGSLFLISRNRCSLGKHTRSPSERPTQWGLCDKNVSQRTWWSPGSLLIENAIKSRINRCWNFRSKTNSKMSESPLFDSWKWPFRKDTKTGRLRWGNSLGQNRLAVVFTCPLSSWRALYCPLSTDRYDNFINGYVINSNDTFISRHTIDLYRFFFMLL